MSDHGARCEAIGITPAQWSQWATWATQYLDAGQIPRTIHPQPLRQHIAQVSKAPDTVCKTAASRVSGALVMGYALQARSIDTAIAPADARRAVLQGATRFRALVPLTRTATTHTAVTELARDTAWVTRPYSCDRAFNDGMTPAHAQLDTVLTRIRQVAHSGKQPVVILDLDDTLFSNSTRTARILSEYVTDFVATHPGELTKQEITRLRAITADQLGYRIDLQLQMQWGITNKAFLSGWWPVFRDHFFTSEYAKLDGIYPGAVSYAHEVKNAGARIVYLTGRHESADRPSIAAGMRAGSEAALKRHGFPTPGTRHPLLMKPTFKASDADYKTAALAQVRAIGTVVATFDNDPKNITIFARAFPLAMHFSVGQCQGPYYGKRVSDDTGNKRALTLQDIPREPNGLLHINHFQQPNPHQTSAK